MSCKRYQRLLWSYASQELSAAEQAAVEQHLTRCARCRHTLQSVQQTRQALHSMPRYRAPESLRERVHAEIARRCTKQVAVPSGTRWTLGLNWRWALAPVLGVLVALLWWWSQPSNPMPPQPSPEVAVTSQEYAETCIEMHQQLEMADWAGTPTANYLITTGFTR
jgi:anti-sigma factor RsiW